MVSFGRISTNSFLSSILLVVVVIVVVILIVVVVAIVGVVIVVAVIGVVVVVVVGGVSFIIKLSFMVIGFLNGLRVSALCFKENTCSYANKQEAGIKIDAEQHDILADGWLLSAGSINGDEAGPSYDFGTIYENVGIKRLHDDLGVNTAKVRVTAAKHNLMRMEQYLQCIDYTLWEIIENGNAPIVTKLVDGKETAIPPISVEDKAQRRA
ncbi:hypothetical protein Tco_1338234 [Tanacetum coccineum]